MRLRIDLAYCGTPFSGWAKQPGLTTVQERLEQALELVFRQPLQLTVAGRTDAGVHAAHQVCHCDIDESSWEKINPERLAARLNKVLADHQFPTQPLIVHAIAPISADFDARFSALSRHYRYLIADTPASATPARMDVWCLPNPLAVAPMHEAAQYLIGEHDFLSFCKPRPGASTIRTLERISVARKDNLIAIELSADAFCHSMVRSIVGALVRVGQGRAEPAWLGHLVNEPTRAHALQIAPPHGLTLTRVDYPEADKFAAQAAAARTVRSL